MAGMHRELVNNNVLFVDEGSQGQKSLQKWHDNDAKEVREIGVFSFKPSVTAHKAYFQLLPNTKDLLVTDLTRSVKVFHS